MNGLAATALALGLFAAPSPQEELFGHWKLDGDTRDAAPGSHPGRLTGRTEFLDSPIGQSGQMLALNGVDASLEIPLPPEAWAGDWTLAWWLFALETRKATIATRGWSLELGEDGTLRWGMRKGILSPSFAPGRWIHVALAVRCEGGKRKGVLYENGRPYLLPDLEAEDPEAPLVMGRGRSGGSWLGGLLDDVRLYRRALSAREVAALTDAGLPWIRPKPEAEAPFPGGKFSLRPHDVVAFLGGENTLSSQASGYLESLLAVDSGPGAVLFRSLAWEGDTALEQPRVLNFGSWREQLERSAASVLVVEYGQVEAIGGKDALGAFIQAYERLLAQLARATRRIVLVSPFPFERPGPPLPDLSARNPDVQAYAEAIRKLAEKDGYVYVDLYTPLLGIPGLTRDGLHLTLHGQWVVAREVARQLGLKRELPPADPSGSFVREDWERLRRSVGAKNRLWDAYWRPTNWAFLAGDRTEQPSSRDHLDHRVRWFPVELQRSQALLGRAEEAVRTLAAPLATP